MPPPKLKLNNTTGKLKTIKKSETSSGQSISSSNSSSHIDNENGQKFELELAWCIQNMESSLSGGKLNANQVQDTVKTLKILKSSNQPLVRKRQVMRSAFGDYRAKMVEEEKKLRIGRRQIQFSDQPKSKSFFVKRSVLSTLGKDKDFKFNFPVPTEQLLENLNLADSNDTKKCSKDNCGPVYTPTDMNSFRFNFEIIEETQQ